MKIELGEVHLWKVDLDADLGNRENLEEILSTDEKERMMQYRFQKTRERFLVGRATLRLILGKYLNVRPNSLRFFYGVYGKPELADFDFYFNLSHSESLLVVAISLSPMVGVDIERMRTVESADSIVRSQFSPSEIDFYFSLSLESRKEIFFKTFTRKEALLKARGVGLTLPLRNVEVGTSCSASSTKDLESSLKLYDLSLQSGYIGSLAVQNAECISHYQWIHGS